MANGLRLRERKTSTRRSRSRRGRDGSASRTLRAPRPAKLFGTSGRFRLQLRRRHQSRKATKVEVAKSGECRRQPPELYELTINDANSGKPINDRGRGPFEVRRRSKATEGGSARPIFGVPIFRSRLLRKSSRDRLAVAARYLIENVYSKRE